MDRYLLVFEYDMEAHLVEERMNENGIKTRSRCGCLEFNPEMENCSTESCAGVSIGTCTLGYWVEILDKDSVDYAKAFAAGKKHIFIHHHMEDA